MSHFSEEQLDSPVGYFAAYPGLTLNNGRWRVIRKIGWGPRSSAWLVDDTTRDDNVEVVKIFTCQATKEKSAQKELDTYNLLGDASMNLPCLRENFFEQSEKGEHLCLIFHVLSGVSVEQYRQGGALPLHNVKQVVSQILEPLTTLHENNVVHGGMFTGVSKLIFI